MQGRQAPWWQDAAIYQVYVRSFADGDGDGVGDLDGIRSRLPYLAGLGIDGIWLTPCYPSPQADHGYDVADPRGIDPLFGTLEQFDALLADAHVHGLKLLMDLVPNHTSDRHPWFQAALAAGPGSPERERYLFRDGRGPDGGQPPNNWLSVFGGPAWRRLPDGQWYLHLFAPEQADLDWRHPEVAGDAERTLRFWLDRGVDGFRIDVAHGLLKDPGVRDNPPGPPLDGSGFRARAEPRQWDQDDVHAIYRRWRTLTDGYGGAGHNRADGTGSDGRMLVGEVWVDDPVRLARYTAPGQLHLAFAFGLLEAPWDAGAWRDVIDGVLTAGTGPATWVLGNHDLVRPVTRYGGGEAGVRRARAALLTVLALPGAVFLYQGDELGLPQVDVPPDDRQDPVWRRSGFTDPGRDGSRVPLPWSGAEPPYGFSPRAGQPWLPQPAGWADLTVAHQEQDPHATLALTRAALHTRRDTPALRAPQPDGTHPDGAGPDRALQWQPAPDGCLAFRRGRAGEAGLLCVANTTGRELTVPAAGTVLLASGAVGHDGTRLTLPADTAAWVTPPGAPPLLG